MLNCLKELNNFSLENFLQSTNSFQLSHFMEYEYIIKLYCKQIEKKKKVVPNRWAKLEKNSVHTVYRKFRGQMTGRMTQVQPPFLWKFGYYILQEEYQVTTLTTNALDLLKINLMRHISLIFPCLTWRQMASLSLKIVGFFLMKLTPYSTHLSFQIQHYQTDPFLFLSTVKDLGELLETRHS